MATGEQILEDVTGEQFLASGGEVDICEECCVTTVPCSHCLNGVGPPNYMATFSDIALCTGCFGQGGHWRISITAGSVNGAVLCPFIGELGNICEWTNVDTGLRATINNYSNAGCVSLAGTWFMKGVAQVRLEFFGSGYRFSAGYYLQKIGGDVGDPTPSNIFFGFQDFPINPKRNCPIFTRTFSNLAVSCNLPAQTDAAIGGTCLIVPA